MSDAAESKATKAKAKSKAGKAGKAPKAKDKTPIWSKGRMKQIMQQDEDVGNLSPPVVPIMEKATQLFIEGLMRECISQAKAHDGKTKKILPGHLKLAVQGNQRFDFLKTLVAAADDLPAKKPAKSEDGKASRKRKAKASSSSEDDDDDDDDAEDSPSPSPKPKPKPKPAKRAKTEHEKADPSSAPAVKLEGKHECKLGSSFSDGGGSSSSGGGGGGGGRSGSGVPPIKQEAAEGSAVFGRPSAVFVERNLDD